jgi:hypothetical protein
MNKKWYGGVVCHGAVLWLSICLSFGAELTQAEYEDNRVIIRTWNYVLGASKNPLQPERFGHASIEIPKLDEYISLWPGKPNHPKAWDVRPGRFNTLIGDYFGEEKEWANHVVCLYSLNIAKMRDAFDEIRQQVQADPDGNTTGWAVLGDNILFSKGSLQHSCASLALALLKAGDVENYFLRSAIPCKTKMSYTMASPKEKTVKTEQPFVTPNNIADIALKARKMERSRYPNIKSIPLFRQQIKVTDADIDYLEEESPNEHESPGTCTML